MVKNLMVFLFVSLAHQNAPKTVNNIQQHYGMSPAMQQAMAQTVQQQQPQQQVNKTVNMGSPMSSSIQQLAGQGNQLGSSMQAPLNDFAPVGFS